ncbi:Nuclease [Labeo rohita]|uniref:Nuclease n=1 Tax=Labeo rohita TaxID=84645 RepID=A0ABQ8L539_LABRO|nr:Nuclease [Labeo rohita]
MVHERDSDKNIIKRYQAISSDYSNSGYDRGLLNPNSFHCEESRKATFTLTNAAPIDAGFNRIHWKNWESALRTVCYKHHLNDSKSFSFGYIGKNQPEGDISLMRVSDLDDQLSRLYSELLKTPQLIRIFVDNCFDDSKKLNEIQGVFDKLINLLANQGDQMATDVKNMSHTLKKVVRSSLHPYLTVSGYWCRNNHPCGTYGKDYYWCWTTSSFLYFFSRWDYCSPPLEGSRAKNGQYCQSNYACSTYGKGYKWCYTENGSSELCCTSDDCHSAVYDKTCWKNHPCGFHGYNYLWCYTDKKAKWQYCCKDCGQ